MIKDSKLISEMRKRALTSISCIDSLISATSGSERFNQLLEIAAQQQEIICIEMRRLCELNRAVIPETEKCPCNEKGIKEVYGEISLTEERWIHIKLNSLLPHCKLVGNSQYVRDSLLRLCNSFLFEGIKLPFFSKAYLAIVERCPIDCSEVFDSDNKGYKAVINVLKGRFFPDDDQFELSLGLFTEQDESPSCHIFILPDDEAAIFEDKRISHSLG